MQRRDSGLVLGIHVGLVGQEQLNQRLSTVHSGKKQGSVAIPVLYIDVRSVLEQVARDGQPAFARRVVQRCDSAVALAVEQIRTVPHQSFQSPDFFCLLVLVRRDLQVWTSLGCTLRSRAQGRQLLPAQRDQRCLVAEV